MLFPALEIQFHHTILLCCPRLAQDDHILSLPLGKHEITVLNRAANNTAFTDAAQTVRTFDVDGIAICDQSI